MFLAALVSEPAFGIPADNFREVLASFHTRRIQLAIVVAGRRLGARLRVPARWRCEIDDRLMTDAGVHEVNHVWIESAKVPHGAVGSIRGGRFDAFAETVGIPVQVPDSVRTHLMDELFEFAQSYFDRSGT